MPVHLHLCLIYLVLNVVDVLHYAVSFLLQLSQKANVLHVVVVDVRDQIRFDHSVGNGV